LFGYTMSALLFVGIGQLCKQRLPYFKLAAIATASLLAWVNTDLHLALDQTIPVIDGWALVNVLPWIVTTLLMQLYSGSHRSTTVQGCSQL